ncbi:MAG: AAA family ATPase, partial [Prochloraceae cyanobacterium]
TLNSLIDDSFIETYGLEKYENRKVLILEDFGGISLANYLTKKSFNIKDFLALAIKITDSLEKIHDANIIHKDINPSNIVYNPKTQRLKIIDFDIASFFSYNNNFKNPNLLEGTLEYISPEQTGRTNRTLDYRSDYYSLGVTFYELTTNQLPFKSKDLLELIHSHLAVNPIDPTKINPNIPATVSNIILKLMEKEPDARYQSTLAIKRDLKKSLQQLDNLGTVANFQLDNQDFSNRFQISQKLYGRENEINTLLKAFEGVRDGANKTTSAIFVCGYSGVGKTALVREIYQSITEAKGYFVEGKFEQYQRDIPYSGLVKAFENLIQYLLTENDNVLSKWRKKILNALGYNAAIIVDVIPKLELIIGQFPEVDNLPPKEAENRFKIVFQKFIKVFVKDEYPIVLFLDDLQWADNASLQLIKLILAESDNNCLLLIGAYRNNEVSAIHPFILTIAEIEKAGITMEKIFLSPLKLFDVKNLISHSFRCNLEKAKLLAKLVLDKTNGNPFFVNEFLRLLYRNEFLLFDIDSGNWRWNLETIKKQNITNNVVELLSGSIKKINPEVQHILKIAACIGNEFEIKILATISQNNLQQTALLLRKVIIEGYVFSLGHDYEVVELGIIQDKSEVKVKYKFSHDRIRQAVYSLIPQKQKSALHWKIGKFLLENFSEQERKKKIFVLVNQFNLGKELIKSQADKELVAQLNLSAGKKAKKAAAYGTALNYLKIALILLEEDSWNNLYELSLDIYIEAAEASYLNGQFEELERFTTKALQEAKTLLDQIRVYLVKIEAYKTHNRFKEALDIGLIGLKKIGINLSTETNSLNIFLKLIKIDVAVKIKLLFTTKSFLFKESIKTLSDLPKMENRSRIKAMALLESLTTVTYVIAPNIYCLIVLEQVNLSLKYGNAMEVLPYGSYGIILCGIIQDFDKGYEFGQLALDLLNKSKNKQFESRVLLSVNACIKHWKKPLSDTLEALQKGYEAGLEVGDFESAALNIFSKFNHLFFLGQELNVIEKDLIVYIKKIKKLEQPKIYQYLQIIHCSILKLIDKTEKDSFVLDKSFDNQNMLSFVENIKDDTEMCFSKIYQLTLLYLFGKYDLAFQDAKIAESKLKTVIATIVVPVFYFYDSLTRIALFSRETKKYKCLIKKVIKNQNKLKKWAIYAPMNYQHKYDLVEAELNRVRGNKEKALNLYQKAIAGARKYEYLNEEGLANELIAKFFLEWGFIEIAELYMREACYKYQLWGAISKVKQLQEKYKQLLSQDPLIKKSEESDLALISGKDSDKLKLETIDLVSVLEANKVLSSELDFKTLLKKLIQIIIENAGASLGYLILNQQGSFVIEAKASSLHREATVLESIPIESKDNSTQLPILPEQIINYVARTREKLVMNCGNYQLQFITDLYIKTIQPKSVLCIRLLNKGQLIGLVYLENKFTTTAFTSERIELLKAIASQAAISIQNARLFKERIETEQALSKKEKQLSDFLEAMPVGV